jgi:hypothetical protein
MKTLLHVGCGPNDLNSLPAEFHDGTWDEIRYDIDPSVSPDIVGRLQDMSLLEDGSIDAVYSSHNVEHVWEFEVGKVLAEFRRILNPNGFALILCPDMMSVAQAITQGYLDKVLYESSAGPITAMDIVYGYHADIARGNLFMAHKTAFTADTLGRHLLQTNFSCAVIARDTMLGLHAVAFPSACALEQGLRLANKLQPQEQYLIEVQHYGFEAG